MTVDEFFNRCQDSSSLRLVGPLCRAPVETDLPIIYIDGGIGFKPSRPHIWFSLGDGDSGHINPQLVLSAEKNFSDLSFGLEIIPPHFKTIHLDGFLGGRKDHEWINFGVIHNFLSKRTTKTEIFFGQKIWVLNKGQWQKNFKGSFSLLCLEDTILRLSGDLKYPYTSAEPFPRLSSLGLSNLSKGNIEVSCDSPVFLMFNP